MMPLMVLDLLKHLPGLSGVYLGAIVAASLRYDVIDYLVSSYFTWFIYRIICGCFAKT